MGPTYSPCPRPILKRPSTVPDLPAAVAPRDDPTDLLAIDRGVLQPVVRFPARPALSKTFSAHSAATYDRSPIVVQPNRCALPERGCPGRTYTLDDHPASPRAPASLSSSSPSSSASRHRSPIRTGRHPHPRAVAIAARDHNNNNDDDDDDPTPRASPHAALPALVPDLSSESDESDGFASPPNELIAAGAARPRGMVGAGVGKDAHAPAMGLAPLHLSPSEALAFLPHPHPPSPPRAYGHGNAHAPEADERERAPRQHRARAGDAGPARKRHARTRSSEAGARYKALSEGSRLSGCSLADDLGCLGGF